MKQLSILIALILIISVVVQAKKYKVFYLGWKSNMDGLWIIRFDINDMENKGEILLYQSEDGIGVSDLLDFTDENVTKITQNSTASIKIPYPPINNQTAIKQVWKGKLKK